MLFHTNFKRVLKAAAEGRIEQALEAIPSELRVEFDAWVYHIEDVVQDITHKVESAFARAPKDNRKVFAIWAQDGYQELAPYLFKKLDGKEYKSLIYKREFDK
jgi:hypothetical protein